MRDYSKLGSGANCDELGQAIEELMQAEQKGYIEIDNAQIIMDNIDSKLAQGLNRNYPSPKDLYHQICKE